MSRFTETLIHVSNGERSLEMTMAEFYEVLGDEEDMPDAEGAHLWLGTTAQESVDNWLDAHPEALAAFGLEIGADAP